jgi:Tol biopolymer transport system component
MTRRTFAVVARTVAIILAVVAANRSGILVHGVAAFDAGDSKCLRISGEARVAGSSHTVYSAVILNVNTGQAVETEPPDSYKRKIVDSPDGKYRIYRYNRKPRNGTPSVQTIIEKLSNGTSIELQGIYVSDHSPKWSPDGKKLAFRAMQYTFTRVDSNHAYSPPDQVVVLSNADGSGSTVIPRGWDSPGYLEWSSDSRYVAVQGSTIGFISAGGILLRTSVPNGPINPFAVSWSPRGDRLAYIAGNSGEVTVNFASPESQTELRFILPPNIAFGGLGWSPDGRRVVTVLGSKDRGDDRRIDVYGIDGSSVAKIGQAAVNAGPVLWSPDGNSIAFRAQERPDLLIAYHLEHGTYETLASDVVDRTYYTPDEHNAVIVQQTGSKVSLSKVNLQNGTITTLIKNVDRVRDIQWFGGGKLLGVHTIDGNEHSLDVVNMETLQTRRLWHETAIKKWYWPHELLARWDVEFGEEQTVFWGESTDGKVALNVYELTGKLISRFVVDDSQRISDSYGLDVIWSPDRHSAVFVVPHQTESSLEVASDNGQMARVVARGLYGSFEQSNVTWAPDSAKFAYVAFHNNESTIDVITSAGAWLGSVSHFEPHVLLEWMQCQAPG